MKLRKTVIIVLAICLLLSVTSCGEGSGTDGQSDMGYVQISAEEAKEIMDSESDYVILDVRTEEEFTEGHIPDAVLLPDYEIAERAEEMLPDMEQIILVYCRSGNRSKRAAETLAQMGYINVKEFGGINGWPYDTVKEPDYRPCSKPGNEKIQ